LLRDLTVAWRLLWDPRVPGLLKLLLPVLALIYLLSPLDLLPGLPFDDIAVLLAAARLFVALAPRTSVADAFRGRRPPAEPPHQEGSRPWARPDEGEVIDTT
jgi:uncharacterized membrane protein YkvA (DUF1232 family)